MSDDLLKNIKEINFIKNKILNFLSIKPRTEYEIINKIRYVIQNLDDAALDGKTKKEIEQNILDNLRNIKLLDDAKYAADFVKEKITSRNPQNKIKIKQFLLRKKIDPLIIETSLKLYTKDDEQQIIEKEIEKKLRTLNDTNPYIVRSKLMKFLISKGYSYEIVKSVVDSHLDVK